MWLVEKKTKIVTNTRDVFGANKSGKFVYLLQIITVCQCSGNYIFIHGMGATPTLLLEGLCDYAETNDLKQLTSHHLHLEGTTKWTQPNFKDRIRSNSLFTGSNLREAVNEGLADFISVFLHEVPLLFRSGAVKLNTISPPDDSGYCTLVPILNSLSIILISAISNKNMPRTFGDSIIHHNDIDIVIEMDYSLYKRKNTEAGSLQEKKIGEIIASNLVDNGATLQTGIGAISDATLASLVNHKDLGIKTPKCFQMEY
ncbi:unnamed protein product [Brugia timori]|uniref:Acetyl-CoA hydrolase n=1 Tax=Brugia timori TaxID=42155 RepID=A0A0R3QNN4_9BILA|nr:unnamed protein product [Brugia timori]